MIDPTKSFARSTPQDFGRSVLLMLIVCTFFAAFQNAEAAVFNVNSPVDIQDSNPGDGLCETAAGNGVCTLRAALMEANAFAGVDTINLQANVTYLSTIGDLPILDSVNIVGAGAGSTIIDGNDTVLSLRVFSVRKCLGGLSCDGQHPSNVVSISGLTIQHGSIFDNGGGIYNEATLLIDHCVLTQNKALKYGGAIYNNADSSLTITNSTISDNHTSASPGGGGGIATSSGLTLKNSTVSGNTAESGGGIYVGSGTLAVIDSTISGNSSNGSGGGIYATLFVTTSLFNSTIAFNRANADGSGTEVGGGIYNIAGSVMNFINSIISMNDVVIPMGQFPLLAHDDCAGTITSQGHNIVTDAIPGHCTIVGTVAVADPQLGPLQNNGGPTFTHALAQASPAIDAGNTGGCTDNFGAILTTDQRGAHRPSGAYCDIGAYEFSDTVFANGFEP